jgi:hypothetical protein
VIPRVAGPFLLVTLLLAAPAAGAETFDQYSVRQAGATTVHRIDRPNVKRALTRYDRIRVSPGDRVVVRAGGCVQTGGRGSTWKRYVDPQGPNSEDYYSGMIQIPGVTDEPRRIEGVVGHTYIATASGNVSLGYQDDDFGNNGYSGHDDGTGDQCRGVGPAWVEVEVTKGTPVPVSSPRYNRVYQKSVHNAYERGDDKDPLERQLGEFKIRSIEIDIHDSKKQGLDQPPHGDFYVYHADVLADSTQCRLFSECLARVASWHRSRPHDPLTIFVDVKDDWKRRSPADVDAQLRRAFGSGLFTPGDLMRACPGARPLQEAVRGACAWPRISEMRNKVLFALTSVDGTLSAYQAPGVAANAAFIAPEIDSSGKMSQWPNAVFFNLDSDHFGTGRDVYHAGFVSRVFYKWTTADVHGINDYKNWRPAVNRFIHHIATDKVDPSKNPWTITYNRNGFPFRCMDQDCALLHEAH